MEEKTESKAVYWKSHAYFMGFDWAKDHHKIVAVDWDGQIVLDTEIGHNAGGWRHLREKLVGFVGPDLSVVATTIETTCGPAVELLLQLGCSVYPLNPKAAQRYRDRKAPSGGKTDHLDALSFADALRTDGHAWRRLKPEDPKVQELRLICRDEIQLIEQRTALVNELRQALQEYYPAVLEAFDDWTKPAPWEFVIQFPTPEVLKNAGKRRWEKFLHAHHLYRSDTYPKRLDIFAHVTEFCGVQAVTNAKSMLAVCLAKQLRVLEQQLKIYRDRIEKLFQEHPDHGLFGSLPGIGEKLGPRLLSECGEDRCDPKGDRSHHCERYFACCRQFHEGAWGPFQPENRHSPFRLSEDPRTSHSIDFGLPLKTARSPISTCGHIDWLATMWYNDAELKGRKTHDPRRTAERNQTPS